MVRFSCRVHSNNQLSDHRFLEMLNNGHGRFKTANYRLIISYTSISVLHEDEGSRFLQYTVSNPGRRMPALISGDNLKSQNSVMQFQSSWSNADTPLAWHSISAEC